MRIILTLCLWAGLLSIGLSQNAPIFSWDNATVYFVINDRFQNGKTSNDHSYNRGFDGNGAAYAFDASGSFHGGDLVGLKQKVDAGYFDSLGVNALWITAPYEQIHGWVAGQNGSFQHYAYHGYYTLDWSEIDANMGTAAELTAFIDAAHARGIRVLFDIVMNHTGYNTAQDMTEFNFGCINAAWKGWRPANGDWSGIHSFIDYTSSCTAGWGNWWTGNWVRSGLPGYPPAGGDNLTMSLAGLPDVKTESTTAAALPPVLLTKWNAAKEASEIAALNNFFSQNSLAATPRNHIIKWLCDWVRIYGVDGFRLDTYKHVEGPAWASLKTLANQSFMTWKANNPSKVLDNKPFWMVAEDFGHGPGRDQTMINNLVDAAINFDFQGQAANPSNLESVYSNYANLVNPDTTWNFLSYISSHDTYLADRTNLKNSGTSLLLCPGAVQIFYGDETARPLGPPCPDEQQRTRSPMNWNSIDQGVYSHWKKLGKFRRKHLAIGAGSHTKINDTPYAFRRSYQSATIQDNVVVVVGASGTINLNVSSTFPDGTALRDFYTGATATVSNGMVSFVVHANGVVLIEEVNPVIRPVVTINPAGTYSPDPITISIATTAPTGGSPTIYYTTDVNLPTTNLGAWNIYTAPFVLNDDATVRSISVTAAGVQSFVASQTYVIGTIPDFTVYFEKPTTWGAPKIYYWNNVPAASLAPTSWPGASMTLDHGNWYKFTFPATLSTNIIFNGNPAPQTGNLFRDRTGYYSNNTWSDTPPASWNPNNGGGTTSTDSLVIHFRKPANWANPKMHYWNTTPASGGSSTWPGITMVQEGTTDWYRAVVSGATCANLIFSNNGANQTANLYRCGEGWYSGSSWFNFNPDATPAGNLVIKLTNVTWANPKLYFWNKVPSNQTINWPGVSMVNEGNGTYSYTFPSTHCVNFIFSNNGATQSPDLSTCKSATYVQGQWAAPVSACPPVIQQALNSVMVRNVPKNNTWNTYGSCINTWQQGPDTLHAFTLTSPETVKIKVGGIKYRGLVTDVCIPDSCIGMSTNGSLLTLPNLPAGTYYIAVERYDTAGASNTYTVDLQGGCQAPAQTYVTYQTATSVRMSWDAVPSAVSYTLKYRKVGVTAWTVKTVTANTFVLGSATTGSQYQFFVQTNCSGNVLSSPTPTQTFTSYSTTACAVPTPTWSNVTSSTAATVYWNYMPTAAGFRVRYRAGTGVWKTVAITTTTAYFKALTALTPNSTYEWQVSAKCGTTYTAYSASKFFVTPPTLMTNGNNDTETTDEATEMAVERSETTMPTVISIRPTLATETIMVDIEGVEPAMWQIVNPQGQLLREMPYSDATQTVDISMLQTGVYYLRAIGNGRMMGNAKFVKM